MFWNVYLNGRVIDSVFFDKYCDADGDLRRLDDELYGLLLHGIPSFLRRGCRLWLLPP